MQPRAKPDSLHLIDCLLEIIFGIFCNNFIFQLAKIRLLYRCFVLKAVFVFNEIGRVGIAASYPFGLEEMLYQMFNMILLRAIRTFDGFSE